MFGLALIAASITPRRLVAQERGAAALAELVAGLGVNTRVLMIGAHPDDEDTFLITWLQRGRHIETAYLSLTRGDGGQNLIGNELGEALGVLRTEELLAARRIDGARQYFTRAFDFGFSKDTIDTYKHWQRDSILGDVVRVVRAFRPHVIIAVFSGTTRDGHGHHQVSGLMARAAYDIAVDTVRFPIGDYGATWTPLKFYRAARFSVQNGTLGMDVGEYSPLLGRSFGEIAGESRSQHKSQGFGALQRKGPILDYVRREASRVNETVVPNAEKSLFEGIDTSWSRFRPVARGVPERAVIDSLNAAFKSAVAALDFFRPERAIGPLARVQRLLGMLGPWSPDLEASLEVARERTEHALALAAGAALDVTAEREEAAVGAPLGVVALLYNRGVDTLEVSAASNAGMKGGASGPSIRILAPGGVLRDSIDTSEPDVTQPWWLQAPRVAAMFTTGPSRLDEALLREQDAVDYRVRLRASGASFRIWAPIVFRFADQVRGELQRLVAGTPAISVTLDPQAQFAPANAAIDRELRVQLRSVDTKPRSVRVTLALPAGLAADSVMRSTVLAGYGAWQTVVFRIRGRLSPGAHRIDALAESDGVAFATGYDVVDYDHVRRQRIYRPASIQLTAVDVRVPASLRVAYITGVGDNVTPALRQLGIPVTVVAAGEVARTDLTPFTTVVIGPRAYDANPELFAANPRLFDFARKGGVLLVQYGQYEMTQPGAAPYAFTINRPHDRVTQEDAPVMIDSPSARELTAPNRIVTQDFDGWVQERALYMPRTFDPAYRSLLSMNDSGESPNKGGILIAPLGDGLYIYTSLSFFRQLPAGVPGAARLFVNLLSARLAPPSPTP